MVDTHREANESGAAVLKKVGRRLIPFLALLYFVAFLDRVNIGFAALTMNEDIGLSAAAYGLGAGIFFIGYVIFEVPSNLILARVGARAWIARIMISWGILSAGMAFVSSPMQFYVMRFLLGVAEAGFFPGVIYYLGCWFPMHYRARILGAFFVALPISGVIGAPLSTWLLGLDGFGLVGWQWMFILEGLPAVVLGFVVLSYMTDQPADAAWLQPGERAWLEAELARERGRVEKTNHLTLLQSLTDIRVIAFGLVYFGLIIGLYAVNFWLPQMVKALGSLTNLQVGLVIMILCASSGAAMVLWGLHSDRTGERRWHVVLPALVAAATLACAAALTDSATASLVAIGLGFVAICAALPTFWTLPAAILTGTAAAGGIALINSIGNIGGFVGPVLLGQVKESTGNYALALWILAAILVAVSLIVLGVVRGPRKGDAPL